MNWGTLISTAVGAITGGAISIAALLLKWRLDRKKEIQGWFYDRYIEDGLDVFIEFLVGWKNTTNLPSPNAFQKLNNVKFDKMPHVAISRVHDIIGEKDIFDWFQFVNGTVECARRYNDHILAFFVASEIDKEVVHLKKIRDHLLILKIHSKHQVHNLPNHETIKTFAKTQRRFVEEIITADQLKSYLTPIKEGDQGSRIPDFNKNEVSEE